MQKSEKAKILKSLKDIPLQPIMEIMNTSSNSPERYYIGDGVFSVNTKEPLDLSSPDLKSKDFLGSGEFWHDFKGGKSGYGIYNFMKYLLEKTNPSITVDEILQTIKDHFLDENYNLKTDGQFALIESSGKNAGYKKKEIDFALPEPEKGLINYGINYLSERRNIPVEVIQEVVKKKTLYVSRLKNPSANGFIENDISILFVSGYSAEVRSIDHTFKGTRGGSDKNISGFTVYPNPYLTAGRLALTEAAVDALSYTALFPERYAVSTNGSGNFRLAYKYARDCWESGVQLRLAMDADYAGDKASQEVFNALYLREHFIQHLLKDFAFKEQESLDKMERHAREELIDEKREEFKEQVDEWIINKDIGSVFYNSPHILFFNSPTVMDSYPKYNETEREHIRNLDNIEGVAPPTIHVEVSKKLSMQLNVPMRFDLTLSPQKVHDFLNGNWTQLKNKVVRDRPLYNKDWNDELKALGSAYRERYSACHQQNFKAESFIFPELGNDLSCYRGHDRTDLDLSKLLAYQFDKEDRQKIGLTLDLSSQDPVLPSEEFIIESVDVVSPEAYANVWDNLKKQDSIKNDYRMMREEWSRYANAPLLRFEKKSASSPDVANQQESNKRIIKLQSVPQHGVGAPQKHEKKNNETSLTQPEKKVHETYEEFRQKGAEVLKSRGMSIMRNFKLK